MIQNGLLKFPNLILMTLLRFGGGTQRKSGQGILTERKGWIQLTSLYQLVRSADFDSTNIYFFLQNKVP